MSTPTANSAPMRALTVIQPWPWAICYWGKPVENRTWAPPLLLLGQRFAIHAGKLPAPRAGKVSGKAWCEVAETVECLDDEGLIPADLTVSPRQLFEASSAIVGTARLAGAIRTFEGGRLKRIDLMATPGDLALLQAAMVSPYLSGPYGWVLADKIVLPKPVPCRGAQGLWTVPADVAASVREQEESRG